MYPILGAIPSVTPAAVVTLTVVPSAPSVNSVTTAEAAPNLIFHREIV
jgi:hypothetical protein